MESLAKAKSATFGIFKWKVIDFYILPDDFDSLVVKTKNETYMKPVLLSRPFLNGHARLNGRLGKIARFSPVFL